MSDLIFRISQNIVLGSYTISRLPQNVKVWGSRFMIVMDPFLKEVGLQDKVLQPLLERKIEYFIYENITDGANTKEIEQALMLAQQGRVHGIIAAGGSKALHLGAAVAALYNENHSVYDYMDGAVPTTASLPLICIPTTMRAPYVFTPFVPVVDSRSRQTKLLKVQSGLCKLVLWDSNLAMTLTDNQKASISIETLCLAVEAYISQKATFFSDMFAEKAAELLSYGMDGAKSLEITTPPEILLAQGGCLASVAAASSSAGVASLLAMTINSRYSISRSLVAAILFPYILEDARQFKAERVEKIGRLMGVIPEGVENAEAVTAFADNIRQRLAKANLPVRLKDLSVSVDQLALAAEDAGQLDIVNSLPRSMTTDDLFDILKQAF